MKYIINFFILLLVSFSFYSCETDDGDINDSPNNKIITEFSYSVNELNTANADVEKNRIKSGIIQRVDYEAYNALKELANISDNRIKFNY